MSFQKYFMESEASEVVLNPVHGVSEAETDITKETFIPELFPYDNLSPDQPDYTYAVVDNSKKKKKKPSMNQESGKDGGRKGSKKGPVADEGERKVGSVYSIGEVSMESQALEVEFEPESGSENEAEEWEKLQETLRDINIVVNEHADKVEMDTLF